MTISDTTLDERFEPMARMVALITDFVPLGVVLVDRSRRVLSANRTARRMAEENDGLDLGRGQLTLDAKGARLDHLLAKVLDVDDATGPAIETCTVMRPSGKRPYRVLAVSLDAADDDARCPPDTACLFISDDEGSLYPEQKWLESLFGLTRTEARLASLLAGGATLEQATADMNIGMPTARTHLSRVLDKTGASRQAELVRIILRSPTLLLGPHGQASGPV